MDRDTFNKFRKIIYDKSGITLGEGKESLVSARIAKRMRFLEIDDGKVYLQYIIDDNKGDEIIHLLDAISTNVTSFFREPTHFDYIETLIPKWIAQGKKSFRFWSSASSTGEEPYSLAITLLEMIKDPSIDIKILATDISTRVLDKCDEGIYNKEKVNVIRQPLVDRYFDCSKTNKETFYRVKKNVKDLVVFKRLNLSSPPFPMKGPFDVVFCRNVMIYFDNIVRTALIREIYRLLKPGGYLMIGHAESLIGLSTDFKLVLPSIYVKD
ncbi:MAG: chemotaxis protein CheR [Candidatus Margulisiibacteriota bacterium]|nr:MAG: chemotaxis protein CheR [Candidatus Margulisbacteria bacterium GWD2_39_127]OGI01576.1 MAG: chemotaxis protein CheR [Candidatus Margulisbacteria bacterium GWF2_38_17]OGI10018.1 MAG: chemotaxis protein CheR [Candidatus Margulisbacteria bacterium GWE2_39_32]PZM78273.1 MAG: chemotaxis protein CheR [Candidatus Margulisiibacteriota bacterium]HAR61839.1 chemotaxis protein CheR [Candidatus Margulisiibacteriota bacterium]